MAKLTHKSPFGTSFHNTTIKTNVETLISILGEPTYNDNSGEDKVNFEWVCENEDGEVFTIYDWKYYRPISKTEIIEWHIGGENKQITESCLDELNILISGL